MLKSDRLEQDTRNKIKAVAPVTGLVCIAIAAASLAGIVSNSAVTFDELTRYIL